MTVLRPSLSNTVVSGARHLAQQITGMPNHLSRRELCARRVALLVASHCQADRATPMGHVARSSGALSVKWGQCRQETATTVTETVESIMSHLAPRNAYL
jgi:hypothetical protein